MSQQTKQAATEAWEAMTDKGETLNRASFEIGFGEGVKWPTLPTDAEVLQWYRQEVTLDPEAEIAEDSIIPVVMEWLRDRATSSMAQQLAAKDAEIAEMKRLISHLSDEADGWKGRATGSE